jgi:glycosyltransferase involved in cell wall biosynthesis
MPTYFDGELDFVGGGDRYAYKLARALVPHGQVTLVTFGPHHAERELDGMRHVIVSAHGGDHENPVPRIGFFMRERFDIVHVFQLRSAVTSALALITRLKRTPLVVTDVGGGGRSLMYRMRLYRFVERFILISDFSRRILPPSVWARSTVVKGGIDLKRFPFSGEKRKRQVLQVGRIMPHKGINYLIEAAAADIPVVIVGRIMDQRYFRQLQGQSRGKQVTFVTDATDDQILDLYQTSSVTVGASVYRDLWGGDWPNSELLGLTMLESMAVGTPVVCTSVGAMPEYVVDGVTGFIVPPNDSASLRDCLLRLLSDKSLASSVGHQGHEHVQKYSWDRVAQSVFDEYEQLLSGSRANRAAQAFRNE